MSVKLPVMNRTVQGYLHMTHEWSQFTTHIRSLLPAINRREAFRQLVDQELQKFQGTFVLHDISQVEIAVVEHAIDQGIELTEAWVEFPDDACMWSFRLAWS